MPSYKDKDGKDHYSMNPQVGKSRFGKGGEKPGERGTPPPRSAREILGRTSGGEKPGAANAETGGHGVKLFEHGDGTYHSEHDDGQRVEHPHLGHAILHLAHHHEPGGKHTHIFHHEGGGMHSMSHVDEHGTHSGPDDHTDTDSLKAGLDSAIGNDTFGNASDGVGAPPVARTSANFNTGGGGSDVSDLLG